MSITEWLISWFERNTSFSSAEICENLDSNYFEKNYVDSFEFISLVGEIESELNISLSYDDFMNRKFSTINGLAEILESK